jgi:hypothetical protein
VILIYREERPASETALVDLLYEDDSFIACMENALSQMMQVINQFIHSFIHSPDALMHGERPQPDDAGHP